jgi:hypothetical protein
VFDDQVVFAEVFTRQLFGYAKDSVLYTKAKATVIDVWAELRSLGLDVTFLLDTLLSRVEEKP